MYAILRTNKHKSISAIARSARHTYREQPTLNADDSQFIKNKFIGSRETKDLLRRLLDKLPISRRKDAVLCIEYLITASPEAFCRHGGHLQDLNNGYFSDALNWLRTRHGQDNILSVAIHLDETTPHLVAYVVPITKDGRLSARDFLGGPKTMRDMQDSFYDACGRRHGLLRGIQGSKARHTDIAQFYSFLHEPAPAETLSAWDYAAKAIGYETTAWKQARAQTELIAQQATATILQRKALRSRTQALSNAEAQVSQARHQAKNSAKKQQELDAALKLRERRIAMREPELDIAIARAEAAERLFKLHKEQHGDEPELSRKKNYCIKPAL